MKQIKKADIVAYLKEKQHQRHLEPYAIAWNIKMHWYDPLGRQLRNGTDQTEYELDPIYDKAWETYLRKDEAGQQLFDWICEDMLNQMDNCMEGHIDPHLDQAVYEFSTAGKSGGYLVLWSWEGCRLTRPQDWEYDWDYQSLWRLYKFCLEVDEIIKHRDDDMTLEYAHYRSKWEVDRRARIGEEFINEVFTVESHILSTDVIPDAFYHLPDGMYSLTVTKER